MDEDEDWAASGEEEDKEDEHEEYEHVQVDDVEYEHEHEHASDGERSEGALTDFATDNETDFGSENDDPFDDFLDPSSLISSLQTTGTSGQQPFERFREERRNAREQRLRQQAGNAGAGPSASAGPSSGGGQLGGQHQGAHLYARTGLNEEDDMEDFKRGRRHRGQGKRARKRKPTHISRGELPPQGIEMMKRANMAFVKGGATSSMEPLLECIKAYPNFVEPYVTLAAAFQDIGLQQNAVNCYAIAAHMKPSDSEILHNTAMLSMDLGLYKQAIWAWSKYVRNNKTDHSAHRQRIEAYCTYLAALDAALKPIASVARMARHAVDAMLKVFPGDAIASEKMPWFLYKMDMPDRAIKFLAEFIAHYPQNVEPTHINMLAQLHVEKKNYKQAIMVMCETLGEATCLNYIDLAVKMGVCRLHMSETAAALRCVATLLQHSATEFNDLYVEVLNALVDTKNDVHGLPLCKTYLQAYSTELNAEDPEANVDDPEVAAGEERTTDLCSQLIEALPAMKACCSVNNEMGVVVSAYELLYLHLPDTWPDYAELMLQLVALLLNGNRQEEAQAVLDQLESRAATMPAASVEIQARRAETHLMSGDEVAFKQVMCSLLQSELQQDSQTRTQLELAMQGVSVKLRRRIERMRRGTLPQSTLQILDPSTSKQTMHAPNPEDHLSVLGQPELEGKGKRGRERRSTATQELDKQAAAMISAFSEAETDGEGVSGRQARMRRLMLNPQLFKMSFKAIELKAKEGDYDWAMKTAQGLLAHYPKQAQAGLQRHKVALLMLDLMCRVHLGSVQTLTAKDQKFIFSAYPYSVRAWSIFCRWCQKQGSVPTRLVRKLRASHPNCLPLMVLRGHALHSSGQPGLALQHYFKAFEMIPDDLLVNLCIAVGYLAHAMSKKVGERHSCILKAFAFFSRYASFSANKQEAAYNLGRAMHQLGLLHLAVDWYERALLMTEGAHGVPLESDLDLRHEAAHNMCLIYSASGAHALAARVMHFYCVV